MTRHRAIERSKELQAEWPILGEATRFIGHTQIRNRGTIGGSLVHNDPSAELPAVMTAIGAQFKVEGTAGSRMVSAGKFFLDYMTTDVSPTELLTEVHIPPPEPGVFGAFEEVSRRHGDFALVAAAVIVAFDADCVVERATLVLSGVGPVPFVAEDAASALVGRRPDAQTISAVAAQAVEGLSPDTDLHADAHYRRSVGAVMLKRALERATHQAEAATT
jgi:CO/xanthine dehydrogenase FAD-binding subunit